MRYLTLKNVQDSIKNELPKLTYDYAQACETAPYGERAITLYDRAFYGEFIGKTLDPSKGIQEHNTQRANFRPHLLKVLKEQTKTAEPIRILDLGSGDGNWNRFTTIPEGISVEITALEPSQAKLDEYARMAQHESAGCIVLKAAQPGTIQDLWPRQKKTMPSNFPTHQSQDLALMIHAGYFGHALESDPHQAITEDVMAALRFLKPGGTFFEVIAEEFDLERNYKSLTGVARVSFERTNTHNMLGMAQFERITAARRDLLGNGKISRALEERGFKIKNVRGEFMNTHAVVKSPAHAIPASLIAGVAFLMGEEINVNKLFNQIAAGIIEQHHILRPFEIEERDVDGKIYFEQHVGQIAYPQGQRYCAFEIAG